MAAPEPQTDWAAILNFVASIVAIVGIPVTVYRTWRTNKAVEKSEKTIARYQILRLLPTLGNAQIRIDAAVDSGAHTDLLEALGAWKSSANKVQGLLADMKDNQQFKDELRDAVKLASTALSDLRAAKIRTPSSMERHTREFRLAATNLSNAADVLETRLSTRSTGGLE
jgi:hypothetical protein